MWMLERMYTLCYDNHSIWEEGGRLRDGRVSSPCGACREYMMQLDKESGEIEILIDLEAQKTIRLKELIPDWWGAERWQN